MKSAAIISDVNSSQATEVFNSKQNVQDYYTEAGPDYEIWSKDFNMHFGLALNPMDCWSREKMLRQMNNYVFKKLGIKSLESGKIYDLGSGLSASLRQAARSFHKLQFCGVTIVPWQVQQSNKMIRQAMVQNAEVKLEDYTNTSFQEASADGVYFIESLCHADGLDKPAPLREAYRLLKPNKKIVIADGMTIVEPENFGKILHSIYRVVCDNWALSDMANVHATTKRLKQIGFKNIQCEDVSWKIAPSAVQSPFLSAYQLIKKRIKREPITEQSLRNLKACFSIFFLGLFRKQIGYFIITAEK
jgi:MPBQ/MSBQ methyltransferase